MGQISLPRLHRLNTSMFWESSYYNELKPYLSIKFYIFINYFSNFFFYYNFFFYKKTNITNKILTIMYTKFTQLIEYNNLLIDDNFIKKLKVYLYIYKNIYYVLFINIHLKHNKPVKYKKKKYIFTRISKRQFLYL